MLSCTNGYLVEIECSQLCLFPYGAAGKIWDAGQIQGFLCFDAVLMCCVMGKISLLCVFGVSSSEKLKNMIKRSGFISVVSCKIKTLNKWNHCCSSNCWRWLIVFFFLGTGEVYLLGLLKSNCSFWVTGSSLSFVSAPFWMYLHCSPHVFFSSRKASW